jgi:hypothetical protein
MTGASGKRLKKKIERRAETPVQCGYFSGKEVVLALRNTPEILISFALLTRE